MEINIDKKESLILVAKNTLNDEEYYEFLSNLNKYEKGILSESIYEMSIFLKTIIKIRSELTKIKKRI